MLCSFNCIRLIIVKVRDPSACSSAWWRKVKQKDKRFLIYFNEKDLITSVRSLFSLAMP